MTVERLLDEMSAAELAEWQAFYRVEPFGEAWQQTGQICAMIGNAAGGKRGGGKFAARDFWPVRPLIQTKRQTAGQILSVFKMLAEATGQKRGTQAGSAAIER